jgi:DNA-directed RNA polymerase specialized sigma24 family protein
MLSAEEKGLIQIVYFQKIKIKDYAEDRGVKYGTVLKRKRVAMEKLRMYLEEEVIELKQVLNSGGDSFTPSEF